MAMSLFEYSYTLCFTLWSPLWAVHILCELLHNKSPRDLCFFCCLHRIRFMTFLKKQTSHMSQRLVKAQTQEDIKVFKRGTRKGKHCSSILLHKKGSGDAQKA